MVGDNLPMVHKRHPAISKITYGRWQRAEGGRQLANGGGSGGEAPKIKFLFFLQESENVVRRQIVASFSLLLQKLYVLVFFCLNGRMPFSALPIYLSEYALHPPATKWRTLIRVVNTASHLPHVDLTTCAAYYVWWRQLESKHKATTINS